MVWIIEWSQPGQGENNATCWDSETNALISATTEILETIASDWDLGEPDCADCARSINDLIAAGNYRAAINEYNDRTSYTDDEYAQYWAVYERPVRSNPRKPTLLSFSDENEVDDEDEVEESEEYKATSSGATCRGPCGTYNEFAYADRCDGTHVCYQCRLMGHVFGKEIK